MIALSDGLDQRYGLSGQCSPMQRLGAGDAATAVTSCRTVDSTLGLIWLVPVSTSRIPSFPIDAAIFPPAPTSM